MDDTQIQKLIKQISPGARRALLALSEEWQVSGHSTYSFSGAWALHNSQIGPGKGWLAEHDTQNRRHVFRLTPMGQRFQDCLKAIQSANL